MTCIKGTYMDEDRHINHYCKTCATPASPHEKVVRPCTNAMSSVIGCVDGFYRQRQSGDSPTADVCAPCSNCSNNTDGNVYEGRLCGEWRDTVCCPRPNMPVIDTFSGPKCVPTVCTEGESLSEDLTSCQPCPAGTYLNETGHIRHVCLSCKDHPVARHCLEHQDKSGSTDGITCGGIVGILVGVFALVGLGIAVGVFLYLKRRCTRKSNAHGQPEFVNMTARLGQDAAMIPLFIGNHEDSELHGENGKASPITPENMPFTSFGKQNLPEAYHHGADLVLDMISNLVELTVHLTIPKTTPNRGRDTGKGRTGCGWVGRVKRVTEPKRSFLAGSLQRCNEDSTPETPTAEIVVCTAASVVFDIKEGNQTTCVFSDKKCILGAKKVVSDHEKDWCYMIFETNDKDLVERLEKNCRQFNRLRCEVLFKFNIISDPCGSEELSKKLDNLHKEYLKKLHLFESLFANIADVAYSNPVQAIERKSLTAFGRRLNLDSLGLAELIASDENNCVKNQSILEMIQNSEGLARCKRSLDKIEVLKDKCRNFTPGSSEEANAQHKYRKWLLEAATLGRSLHLFKYVFVHHWGDKDAPKYPKYEYRYDHNHPFTIVITFKDDRSTGAAVKLGQVTLRKSMWFDHHSIYSYTNLTEPGDEGAPVLVMGNRVLHCHGHSGMLGRTSESGAWSDLIPCIANFSGSTPVDNDRT